ncbi:F-box protein [Hibiscus syriacus]|uniref:F-box protein n=1 Tax=Hibiscus syriacus TaxID=106335 RepID=A0A6A2YTS4_HIBSY|nr:F-box protein [Hibiscus syriacus]
MAGVCSSLRSRCISDHFWEKHVRKKCGRIVGPAAYREWQWHIALRTRKDSNNLKQGKPKDDSIMSWFLALQTGRFWFPAQVYNRENGHVGFMLSCYDAELSTLRMEGVTVENNVPWERLQAPPFNTSPHDLHISDCLNELRPGDNIEIQWRKNEEFPYGWWYGVVGHLESCDRNENCCQCHKSDGIRKIVDEMNIKLTFMDDNELGQVVFMNLIFSAIHGSRLAMFDLSDDNRHSGVGVQSVHPRLKVEAHDSPSERTPGGRKRSRWTLWRNQKNWQRDDFNMERLWPSEILE